MPVESRADELDVVTLVDNEKLEARSELLCANELPNLREMPAMILEELLSGDDK